MRGRFSLVTHDQDLIEEAGTRIWHFEGGPTSFHITDHKGPYEEYEQQLAMTGRQVRWTALAENRGASVFGGMYAGCRTAVKARGKNVLGQPLECVRMRADDGVLSHRMLRDGAR